MHGIDAVVQVLPEAPFPHQLLQMHIGSADQPDINGFSLRSAHPNHAPVLDYPK